MRELIAANSVDVDGYTEIRHFENELKTAMEEKKVGLPERGYVSGMSCRA